MSKVTVHQFEKYDINSDSYVRSRRFGTVEAVERIGGRVIPGTSVEVAASEIDTDVQGLTAPEFNPNPRTGFQTVVKS